MSPAIAQMSDAERLEYVRGELARIEADAARAVLTSWGQPTEERNVGHLVFVRYLYMTMRLREHAV